MTWLMFVALFGLYVMQRRDEKRVDRELETLRRESDERIAQLPPELRRMFWREPPKLPPAPKEPLHEEGPFR